MHLSPLTTSLLGSSVLYGFLSGFPVIAQIVPDVTLPINSVVDTPGGGVFTITGGTPNSGNTILFHSFSEFSIPAGGAANFDNAVGIQDIFTRITGNSISDLDGSLSTNGANLTLINPNGIVFGENVQLNVEGSFLATTANSIDFGGAAGQFGVSPLESPSLLTVTAPIGLDFGASPGRITSEPIDGFSELDGLPPGETLALVGGELVMGSESAEGPFIFVEGGRIELGSVAGDSSVDITPTSQGWQLNYDNVQEFQDIRLSGATNVGADGDGGGPIQIQGKNVILRGESLIFSDSFGSQSGEAVTIQAAENLILLEGSQIFTTAFGDEAAGDLSIWAGQSLELSGALSTINSLTESDGNSGRVSVEARQILIRNGGFVSASTRGAGNAGDLTIAVDRITLQGTTLPNGENPSGLFSQVIFRSGDTGSRGNGANLTINTRELTLLEGAQISTAARSDGEGGNLTINASGGSILLSGTAPEATPLGGSSGIFTSAEPGSTKAGGNLIITTDQLTVEEGARISADTFGQGPAGTATLTVDRLVLGNGGQIRAGSLVEEGSVTTERGDARTLTVNAAESIDIFGIGTIGTDPTSVSSALVARAEGTGNAGSLQVSTPRLTLQDGGQITAESLGEGTAGNINLVVTDALEMRGDLSDPLRSADIRTDSAQSSGGAITITGDSNVLLTGDSDIRTNVASGAGDGGDILIRANSIIALDDSDILAFAQDGRGGDITLDTPTFLAENFQPAPPGTDPETLDGNDVVDINASGAIAGIIILPDDTFIENELAELPGRFIDPDALVASSCVVRSQAQTGQFIITGSGSLPERPGEASILPYSTGAIRPLPAEESTEAEDSALWRRGDPIVEPQGAYPLTDGRLVLSRECDG